MAILQFSSFNIANVLAIVYFDDVALNLTRVEITNSSDHAVKLTVNKLTNPKKEYSGTFQPGAFIAYDLPKGFSFTITNNGDGTYDVSPYTITMERA